MTPTRAWLLALAVASLFPSTAAAETATLRCTGYMPPRPPQLHLGGPANGPLWEYGPIYDGLADLGVAIVDVGARTLAAMTPAPAMFVRERARPALMWSVSFAVDGERDRHGCWRIPRHRIAIEAGTVPDQGFASRIGYRYVVQPARSPLGVTMGLGAQLTAFDHIPRVAASPEAGLRLGRTERPGALALTVRRDIPFDRAGRDGAWWFLASVSFF